MNKDKLEAVRQTLKWVLPCLVVFMLFCLWVATSGILTVLIVLGVLALVFGTVAFIVWVYGDWTGDHYDDY